MKRTDVTDFLAGMGYVVSYRGFTMSDGTKCLAIDTAEGELVRIMRAIQDTFPKLSVSMISRFPYASGNRIIVKGF